MIAPGDKGVIQIIITSACDLRCSNCTQMIAQQKKRFLMTVDNFRAAVRSLADYHGVIGVFGGNPCLHPHFDDLCRVMAEEIPDRRRRGLWSNNIHGHGAAIRGTYGYFNLNGHHDEAAADEMRREVIEPLRGKPGVVQNTLNVWGMGRDSMHAPVLVAIRDMIGKPGGPKDEAEMWATIEECDVNRRWSGAITQLNGELRAFFCEVAASFALLYDEDNGIPVTPRWWAKPIGEYDHQVNRWCPGCGVPLRMAGRRDDENTDDASVMHLPVLGERRQRQIHDAVDSHTHEATDYASLRGGRR